MKINWGKYLGLLIAMVLLQTLVLNHVAFFTYMNPYVYIILILMIPKGTPKQLVLLYAFSLGLLIDFFSDSAGLHAGASTLIAFVRTTLLKYVKTKEGYGIDNDINVFSLGVQRYLVYGGILVLIHHSYLFIFEAFKWNALFSSISKAFLSSILTFVLILISQYLFVQKKAR